MTVMLNSLLAGKLIYQLITPGLWAEAHVGKFLQIFINSNGKIRVETIEGTEVNFYSMLGNVRDYNFGLVN